MNTIPKVLHLAIGKHMCFKNLYNQAYNLFGDNFEDRIEILANIETQRMVHIILSISFPVFSLKMFFVFKNFFANNE